MKISLYTLGAIATLAASVVAQTPGTSSTNAYGCPTVCHAQNDPPVSFIARSLPNEYAHAVQMTTAETVAGFSMYLQTVSTPEAIIQVALYREDPTAPGQPDPAPVATGSMCVGSTLGWYSAAIDPPVAVTAGELFFISADTNAVRPPDDSAGATPPAASFWRRPPFGGSGWSRTGIINSPIYRIHCLGGANGVANLIGNAPTVGNNLDLTVVGSDPAAPNFFALGFTAGSFPLDGIGARGCTLLVTPNLALGPIGAGPGGTATISLPVPSDPTLIGVTLHSQALTLSAGSGAFRATNNVKSGIGG